MKRLVLAVLVLGCAATVALAQGGAPRTPLPARVTDKLGMLNVPALSPLWLLPEYAAAYNIQIETVMFQRFADGRTALASGDLDITAFGPQDITLAVAQGARSLVGVAGVGSGNDCLLVRRGEDIRDWKELGTRKIGIGAGSISWLKFAASVQEHGVDYGKLRITNIVGGGANYLKALQGKEIDLAVVWQPFCAQGLVDGYAQYPTLDHNRSKAVGGLIAVLAVNRDFMEKHRDAATRLHRAHLEVPVRQRRHHARRVGRDRPALHLRVPVEGHREVARGAGSEPVSDGRAAPLSLVRPAAPGAAPLVARRRHPAVGGARDHPRARAGRRVLVHVDRRPAGQEPFALLGDLARQRALLVPPRVRGLPHRRRRRDPPWAHDRLEPARVDPGRPLDPAPPPRAHHGVAPLLHRRLRDLRRRRALPHPTGS